MGDGGRIGLTWVRETSRGDGLGGRLLAEFETEATSRGCTHVFVTSFTFQAPGFYERHGYRDSSDGRACPRKRMPTCTSARTSEAVALPVRRDG